MDTKYSEGVLAIKYREVDENGEMVALFGIGTFGQVKSIADAATKINIRVKQGLISMTGTLFWIKTGSYTRNIVFLYRNERC